MITKRFDITAKYPEVLAAAKKLAQENPEKVTAMRTLYWDEEGNPNDLVSATLEATGFHPYQGWLKLHNHQHVMFWGDRTFADWAVAVFISRLQRAIDSGKTWEAAVLRAENQTRAYYADPVQSRMIELMLLPDYHPDSTKKEVVLK